MRVSDGYRTIAEQNELYQKGRRGISGEKKVTNAKGGSSNHNYGLAIDIYQIEDGGVIWEPVDEWIVQIAESYGFEWGGYWTNPYDPPHFEKTFGYSTSELLERVNNGDTNDEGYVNIQ